LEANHGMTASGAILANAQSERIVVRACRENDLPKLEWFGAFAHHRQIIHEAFVLQRAGKVVMLVADDAGFPVGQAWLDFRRRERWDAPKVWAVRVMPALQGRGIGAKLMSGLENVAWQRGHNRLMLGVEKANASACQFYERLGWRLMGDRREEYRYLTPAGISQTVSVDQWVFFKTLPPARGLIPTRR
jgi:GNAT superfamily N-acetyltransferase